MDPIPTTVIKKCIDHLLPILVHIINASIINSVFPNDFKKAIVTPIIKDATKSSEDYSNYRPVSNLPFLSKVLERVLYVQLNKYIEDSKLHSKFQSFVI